MEPLAGILRDPRHACWEFDHVSASLRKAAFVPPLARSGPYGDAGQRKYSLLDPALARKGTDGRPPRAILIDMGGSKWSDAHGLRWLVEAYAAVGVEFEHIYVWEAQPMTPRYWDGMPVAVRRRVHFYNLPASAIPGDANNPWETVRLASGPDDLVVVKLDIDTPTVETPLVQQLLDDPALLRLVDDFYFEHHVVMPEMQRLGWGDLVACTLADSYELFRRLRLAGVRAHSWP
jgi:hypothetical protein